MRRALLPSLPRALSLLSPAHRLLLSRALATLPPHAVVPFPALSPTMASGVIAEWLFKEGDAIKSGAVIARVETDKVGLRAPPAPRPPPLL